MHILYKITYFENRAFYEAVWKYFVQPGRPQTTIRCMRIARLVPKATNAHSEYVLLISFTLQQ